MGEAYNFINSRPSRRTFMDNNPLHRSYVEWVVLLPLVIYSIIYNLYYLKPKYTGIST